MIIHYLGIARKFNLAFDNYFCYQDHDFIPYVVVEMIIILEAEASIRKNKTDIFHIVFPI